MKARHPYYYLTKESGFFHRFVVYSKFSQDIVLYVVWNGGDLIDKGVAFGFSHGIDADTLPEPMSHLREPMEEMFLAKTNTDWPEDPQVGIAYEGYTVERRVECLIALERREFSKDDLVEGWWSPLEGSYWECYHEETTFLIDQQGEIKLSHGGWPGCSDQAFSNLIEAPYRVYDFRSSLPVWKDRFLKENYHFALTDRTNSELAKLICTDNYVDLASYNRKYHLEADLSLQIFRPRLEEWRLALRDLGPTEQNLIAVLPRPDLFLDPHKWLVQQNLDRIGIARAFLSGNSKCIALFNRIIHYSAKPRSVWEALVELDPEFPYPIIESPVLVNRLPSPTCLPDQFYWLHNKNTAWLIDLMPDQVRSRAQIKNT